MLYNSLVENSLPVILVLFLGVWSDANRRRKPPLLLSLVGKLLRSLGLFLNAWFMDWPPIVLLFTAALPHSLGGANAVFHMASFRFVISNNVCTYIHMHVFVVCIGEDVGTMQSQLTY